jgi:hypothetical protein
MTSKDGDFIAVGQPYYLAERIGGSPCIGLSSDQCGKNPDTTGKCYWRFPTQSVNAHCRALPGVISKRVTRQDLSTIGKEFTVYEVSPVTKVTKVTKVTNTLGSSSRQRKTLYHRKVIMQPVPTIVSPISLPSASSASSARPTVTWNLPDQSQSPNSILGTSQRRRSVSFSALPSQSDDQADDRSDRFKQCMAMTDEERKARLDHMTSLAHYGELSLGVDQDAKSVCEAIQMLEIGSSINPSVLIWYLSNFENQLDPQDISDDDPPSIASRTGSRSASRRSSRSNSLSLSPLSRSSSSLGILGYSQYPEIGDDPSDDEVWRM